MSSPSPSPKENPPESNTPTTTTNEPKQTPQPNPPLEKYNTIILDTSSILQSLHQFDFLTTQFQSKCQRILTVPGVIQEIRDSKSRAAIEQNHMLDQVQIRPPSPEAIGVITKFARLTGDYPSLSCVDLHVLALLYELEVEGCGNANHLRTEPKHILGKGKIEPLNKSTDGRKQSDTTSKTENSIPEEEENKDNTMHESTPQQISKPKPTSWANAVNPAAAPVEEAKVIKSIKFLNLDTDGGQFDDAEETESEDEEEEKEEDEEEDIEHELSLDFPSLSAAITVPDPEEETNPLEPTNTRHYNSFTKYSHIVKPDPAEKNPAPSPAPPLPQTISSTTPPDDKRTHTSRIMGGTEISGQSSHPEEDDGIGWISVDNLSTVTFPSFTAPTEKTTSVKETVPRSKRSACATTDFAMQNVILQMGLCLLDLHGNVIRRVKYWVYECRACYMIHTAGEERRDTLFCSKCGNYNTLHRISASLDSKSGRLKLYRSKKGRRQNLRGTKFSLPNPNKQPKSSKDRFQGPLLLRPDQLDMGVWNQKVKRQSNKKKECIFGSDIVSDVGLSSSSDFILQAGFGKRNPNASKFGRERRGKKGRNKSEKQCGLRRY